MNLKEIAVKSQMLIEAINESEQLLATTYGVGCTNMHGHVDHLLIGQAARTLVVHLSWLKARAIALDVIYKADKQTKMDFVGLIA